VQIIKRDPERTGKLQFGTEVVASADGSIAVVLGASPGASTSPTIMLDVLERCFPEAMASSEWRQNLEAMVPAYGVDLAQDFDTYQALAAKADAWLQLDG
jgi:malate dehydrogenase (quinone)